MRPQDTQACKSDPVKSKREMLDDDIEQLRDKAAIFCLKALMLAGHVSETAMRAVVDLSNTVRHD